MNEEGSEKMKETHKNRYIENEKCRKQIVKERKEQEKENGISFIEL